MIQFEPFTRTHLAGATDLFAVEGWGTYTDRDRTYRALTAPGCTTLVAVDGDEVAGLVQFQSDGEIQAHLSALIVGEPWRRHRLGRKLLREALKRAGGTRIDLLSRAGHYYQSLGAESIPGYRLTRKDVDLENLSIDGPAIRRGQQERPEIDFGSRR
jgi:ribosomal protein S18 acetylase RimI-like enzyme